MKNLIIAFGLFISTNVFATTYCVVPVGSPDVFHDVQKFAIDSNDGFEVTSPVHGYCSIEGQGRYIQCQMKVNGSDYEAVLDWGLASTSEYQEAGTIVKKAKIFRDDTSSISCMSN
jgi:hypothetical protein